MGRRGTWKAGVVYGFAISLASSVVLIRVLSTTTTCTLPPAISPSAGRVLKDLFTVVALVLIPCLRAHGRLREWGGLRRRRRSRDPVRHPRLRG